MISERENLMKMMNRQRPDFVSHQPSLLQMIVPSAMQERGPQGASGYDWFGVKWSVDPNMPMAAVADANQEHILQDISDWSDLPWPDLSAINWEACAKKDVPEKDPNRILCAMMLSGPFERLHDLMGFEDALCALITDPEECGGFFSRICDMKVEELEYLKKYYDVDMVHFQDDWGSQKDLFFSPEIWKTYIRPHIQRVVNKAHELGIIFDMHSCGKIDRIIEDIIEMGVDMIDPVQPVNDYKAWLERYKDKVIFMGGLNAQDIIDHPETTKEEIQKEVKEKTDLFAKEGYYIPFAVSLYMPNRKIALDESFIYGRNFYEPGKYDEEIELFKKKISQSPMPIAWENQ